MSNYTERDRVNVILANPPFGGTVANNNETNFPQNFRTKESADLFLILMIHLLKMGGRAGIVLPDGSLTGEGVKQRVRERLLTECNLHTIIRLPNSVFQPSATVATNLLFFDKERRRAKYGITNTVCLKAKRHITKHDRFEWKNFSRFKTGGIIARNRKLLGKFTSKRSRPETTI